MGEVDVADLSGSKAEGGLTGKGLVEGKEGEGQGGLGLAEGSVREFEEMKDLSRFLEERGMKEWWVAGMGFERGGG